LRTIPRSISKMIAEKRRFYPYRVIVAKNHGVKTLEMRDYRDYEYALKDYLSVELTGTTVGVALEEYGNGRLMFKGDI